MDPEENPKPSSSGAWNSRKFGYALALFQVAFIALFAAFVEYDWDAIPASKRPLPQDASLAHNATDKTNNLVLKENDPRLVEKYPLRDYLSMYGDIQVMVFIAFGLLIACFKRYGYSSIGIALVIGSFVVQWSLIMNGLLHLSPDGKIKFSLITLISADFAIAAVLISTCVLLGTLSPLQYIILAFFEVAVYNLNEWISLNVLRVVDVGGSIYLHTFSAYFGLAVSLVLNRRYACTNELKQLKFGSQLNEIIAMIGTLFLFVYWPSFNAVFCPANQQGRAVLNTALSLIASVMGAFVASAIMSKGKLNLTVIQNGSLAGGVAIGTTADLMIGPFAALTIGFTAGVITVVGFLCLNPIFERKLQLVDVCGVQFLHGFTGIFAALVSMVLVASATEEVYGSSFSEIFPAVTIGVTDIVGRKGPGRTIIEQAVFQLLSLIVSIMVALVSGMICGLLLKLRIFDPLQPRDFLRDDLMWSMPETVSRDREQAIRDTLDKLNLIVAVQKELNTHSSALKDQLKGLEACLKG